MSLRSVARYFFKRFRGLNSYAQIEDVANDWWTDSLNVTVNAKGSAEVMRSPRNFNVSVGSGEPVISMADYLSSSTHKLLIDIAVSGGATLNTYTINDDLTNALIRSGQHNIPWISVVANGKLFRVNQYEMIQWMENITTFYRVGIDPPAAAPVISYSTDSDSASESGDDIAAGIQFSYAYYNSTTKHCSRPSPISNRLGAGGESVHVPVIASAQSGVDTLVFFATLDGGSIPYLLITKTGDLNTRANTTATTKIDLVDINYDTLTPQPVFNYVPPLGAQFMFTWLDRVFLMNFVTGSAISMSAAAYSGVESCYIGQPAESWPPLNQVSLPARGETLRGGIGTQVGALFLSDLDAYLLSGYPSDKTSGPEAATAVSETFSPLHWNIGTQSPRTIRNTPFGTVWLDQAKRLRLWQGQGFPTEVGVPLNNELAKLDSTFLAAAEAQWFQESEHGGYYVLTSRLSGGSTQRIFLVSIFQDAETGEQIEAYAISDIQAYSLAPVRVFSTIRMFIGGINQTYIILDPNKAGSGWPGGTNIFFEHVFGNEINFVYWHSLRFDGDLTGLTVSIRDYNEAVGAARTIAVSADDDTGTSLYGLIDEYGRRKILRFSYSIHGESDSESDLDSESEEATSPRQIKNLQVVYQNKNRVI